MPKAERARDLPADWNAPALHPEEHAMIEKIAGRKLSNAEAWEALHRAENLAAIGLRLAERKDLA